MSKQTFAAAQDILIGQLGLGHLALVPVVHLELDPLTLFEAEVDGELGLPRGVGVVVDLLGAAFKIDSFSGLFSYLLPSIFAVLLLLYNKCL